MKSDFSTLDNLYPLPPEDLPRQWALRPAGSEAPAGWQVRDLKPHRFIAQPKAQLTEIVGRSGGRLGWAVEMMLRVGGGVAEAVGERLMLPLEDDAPSTEVEEVLHGRCGEAGASIEGPWVALIEAAGGSRLCCGPTHSAVFSRDHRSAASSHNLIPGLERDLVLSELFDPLARNGFYPFGLTAFKGLERLLPNHSLDLSDFSPSRRWPTGRLGRSDDGPSAAATIVEEARTVVG